MKFIASFFPQFIAGETCSSKSILIPKKHLIIGQNIVVSWKEIWANCLYFCQDCPLDLNGLTLDDENPLDRIKIEGTTELPKEFISIGEKRYVNYMTQTLGKRTPSSANLLKFKTSLIRLYKTKQLDVKHSQVK